MKINEIYEKLYKILEEAEENVLDEGGLDDSELETVHEKVENAIEVLKFVEKYSDELYIAQNLGAGTK